MSRPELPCTDAGTPAPRSLEVLRQTLEGGASIVCCRHPDIDSSGYGPEHPMRQCVLDDGNPEHCDQSASDAPNPVTEKTACQFWLSRQFKRPQRISIADAKWLVAELEAARAGTRVAARQLRAAD